MANENAVVVQPPEEALRSPSTGTYRATLDFVRAELAANGKRFDDDSKQHKRMHRRLRGLTIFVTACSSVLAAVAVAKPELQVSINLVIVLLTAAVGVISAFEAMRKPNELWIHERTTYYGLKDIERELEFRVRNEEPAAIHECFERMQALLGASSEKWNREVVKQRQTGQEGGQVAK
jgi:Protein of unknown function (DUF4231)